jgi:hypothetical protein
MTDAIDAAVDASVSETAAPVDVMASMDSTMNAAYDRINTPREDNGTFKAADGERKAEPAPQQLTDQPKIEAPKPEETPVIEAPKSWSADKKMIWDSLSPDAKKIVSQREHEAHSQISEQGRAVQAFEPIKHVLDHFQDTLQANNLTAPDAIARMFAVERDLRNNPVETIKELAAAYGIDLSAVGQQPAGDESVEVRSLKAEVAQLRKQVGETNDHIRSRATSELNAIVQTFAKSKEDFSEIENDMVNYVAAIRAAEPNLGHKELLEKAYEAARWGNPNTRTKMLENMRKEEETKRTEEAKKKADAARKVGNLNVKSLNGSGAKKTSWLDTVDAVAGQIMR